MTRKQCALDAADLVIGLTAEKGITYQKGDFEIIEAAVDIVSESEWGWTQGRNLIAYSMLGITVALQFDFPPTGKKLKKRRTCFADHPCCTVGRKGLYFNIPISQTNKGTFELAWQKSCAEAESGSHTNTLFMEEKKTHEGTRGFV